jgi:excisionase family DNA binding protein
VPIRTTKKNKLLTTKMAADILGFTSDYIRHLIVNGKIKAEKLGHDYLMTETAIRHVKRQRFSEPKEVTHGSVE